MLYLSLQRHDSDNWLTFAARRMARLYPPVAVAVLLSAALYLLVDPPDPGAARRLAGGVFLDRRPGLDLVGGHLLLLDIPPLPHARQFDVELVLEVRLWLLFPLVTAGVRRRPVATLIGCLILSGALVIAVARFALCWQRKLGGLGPISSQCSWSRRASPIPAWRPFTA